VTRSALALLGTAVALAACGDIKPPPLSATAIAPPVSPLGLDRVIGRDARSLVTLFGPADQDVWEASARKLQFGSAICILDAFLYPPAKGKEPVVTYVEARQNDGSTIDKASCVAALTRRKEAR
jgi:hypothetical protein